MTVISLAEAQSNLADLIRGLLPGDEIVITDNNRPIARLTASEGSEQVAAFPISNARLLETAQNNRPPASWYEGDEEDLFE